MDMTILLSSAIGCAVALGLVWLARLAIAGRARRLPVGARFHVSDDVKTSTSVRLGYEQHEALLRACGAAGRDVDRSALIRACIFVGLPILQEHPALIRIANAVMDKDMTFEDLLRGA
ncbi:MAG: hypothetical protein AB7E47_02255 [Desulfovibrionaceae bacterium]